MIRIEVPASLRPTERYGLDVLVDLSRLLVAENADCEVVRLTVIDRSSAGSAAADLSPQAALERTDGKVGIGLASLRAVAEVAGGAIEQRSTASDRFKWLFTVLSGMSSVSAISTGPSSR